MQVKEIDINTGKIKGYGICKKKYKISFLGGPTTPTYSTTYINLRRNIKPKLITYTNRKSNINCSEQCPLAVQCRMDPCKLHAAFVIHYSLRVTLRQSHRYEITAVNTLVTFGLAS